MFLNEADKAFVAIQQQFLACKGVTTDTRTAGQGQLFFALKGEHFNGNLYAQSALDLGCVAAVVDEIYDDAAADTRYIRVPDVLAALQSLARWHRRSWSCPVIGLTGSNGKTTTKELIKCVLEERFDHVHATIGNFNNEIGVPLTLLSTSRSPDIAIIEMGANAQGEIGLLAQIAEPDFGIITNIGRAHLEGFGGESGVLKGKGELFDFLRNCVPTHTVFVHNGHPKLMSISAGMNRIEYGSEEHPPCVTKALNEQAFTWKDAAGQLQASLRVHISGSHNRENILAAITIGQHFGVSADACALAISQYTPTNNRSQWHRSSSNQVLLDAYNANPSSMLAALEAFIREAEEKVPETAPVCILGDMAELGEYSQQAHTEIIEKALTTGAEVYTVGPLFQAAAYETHSPITAFRDTVTAAEFLEQHPVRGRAVLLKGSRSIALEALLKVL